MTLYRYQVVCTGCSPSWKGEGEVESDSDHLGYLLALIREECPNCGPLSFERESVGLPRKAKRWGGNKAVIRGIPRHKLPRPPLINRDAGWEQKRGAALARKRKRDRTIQHRDPDVR